MPPALKILVRTKGEIFSCRFDPAGQNIAAVSSDRSLSLWRTYPPNTNYGHITALHKAPILDLQWSLVSPIIHTVSADKSINALDVTTGVRTRRIRGAHSGIINALDRVVAGGSELLASGGDDNYVRVWDAEKKDPIAEWDIGCPVTAICWSSDGAQVYAGSVDNAIHVCFVSALFVVDHGSLDLGCRRSGTSESKKKLRHFEGILTRHARYHYHLREHIFFPHRFLPIR